MKVTIESIIRRENGTIVDLDSVRYHFKPSGDDPRHVYDVEKADHVQKFLAIKEGFRLLDGDDAKPVDEGSDKDNDTDENDVVDPELDDTPIGSDEQETLQPGDDEQGDGDQDDESSQDDSDTAKSDDEKGDAESDDNNRESLAKLYAEKVGSRPHGKWTTERIKKELDSL